MAQNKETTPANKIGSSCYRKTPTTASLLPLPETPKKHHRHRRQPSQSSLQPPTKP
ncbi:hypothetical protein RHGRI_018184 [Rhododendron griersonianum]|uniref:Uncharacterized protein n=1 Tax=Rhododendron griersonianum TaxID=479676 RepID=A0AAV6K0I6_9ERIC|nr:hypothetical protein RHGRI_018184 [Rhododendron griersonianum]